MGEYADMILDGTVCAGCGEFMEGEGDGIQRYCSRQCEAELIPVATHESVQEFFGVKVRTYVLHAFQV